MRVNIKPQRKAVNVASVITVIVAILAAILFVIVLLLPPCCGKGNTYSSSISRGNYINKDKEAGNGGPEVFSLYLNALSEDENVAYSVKNMFPGDIEERFWRVSADYSGDLDVKFRVSVRPGYDVLANALSLRVVLLNTGETLFDGLMEDANVGVITSLRSTETTTSDLYYRTVVSLPTSAGNECQNKSLVADFIWEAENEENLKPGTGTKANVIFYEADGGSGCHCYCKIIFLIVIALFVIANLGVFMLTISASSAMKKFEEDEEDEEEEKDRETYDQSSDSEVVPDEKKR